MQFQRHNFSVTEHYAGGVSRAGDGVFPLYYVYELGHHREAAVKPVGNGGNDLEHILVRDDDRRTLLVIGRALTRELKELTDHLDVTVEHFPEVEAEEYVGVCKKCGLRFKRLPRRRKTNG